ncbi:MAG: SAM-dependent methyltransferase [Halofilum sp. (in: g-proteobacteria)]|nr:SAM-dependent methyltransferase [Halofilum sp. (in: g-proteobacteria)]
MELALYEPGLGYYAAAGGAALAGGEDFVTAPAVSPLFARCLARQCAPVLAATGGDVLELGRGSGELAAELLAALEALEALPRRYRILEPSAELQQQQHARLAARVPHLLARCTWERGWPRGLHGVVLANEVLDAMPVEGFRVAAGDVEQRCTTTTADGGLGDAWRSAPEALRTAIRRIEADLGRALPAGYRSEYNPQLDAWFAGLAAALERGAVLLVDYGYVRAEYYLPERSMGTLVCTRAHRAHDDPYDWPGLTDITAFVDFTAVTEAATGAGLELEGFTPQAHFLIGCGLDEVSADALASEDERERLAAAQQVKRLTLPGEMGERFNVIGFSKGLEEPLEAFAVNDLSRRL